MVDILSDQQREADKICLHGIEQVEESDLAGAHQTFLKAYEMDPTSPKIQSWLGYTTALVEKRVAKALDLCRKAIDSQVPDAMFYRNIGKVYLLQNNKRGAIGAFSKGLQIDKGNRAILNEWKVLGFRRKPFFGFLDRGHWLNIKLGRITWNLKNRNAKK